MSQELLYTSAPRGLKPGSRGFCTVLSTQGMAAPLTTALEGLSGYRPVYPTGDDRADRNPVVYSHLKLQSSGRVVNVLSRIADFGLDYSQRANKLAHHVVLDRTELLPGGPANLLSMRDFMRDEWSGEPTVIALKPVKRETDPPSGVCRTWQELTGDAGWAGVLAESFLQAPDRLVVLLFAPGQDILPLFNEAISLLPVERRWDVTFSTYFTGLATGTTCTWRAIVQDSKDAHESLRFVNALRLDLTSRSLGRATGGPLVDAARSGARPHNTPARATSRTGPSDVVFAEAERVHVEFSSEDRTPASFRRTVASPQPLKQPQAQSAPPPQQPSDREPTYKLLPATTSSASQSRPPRSLADVIEAESQRPGFGLGPWLGLGGLALSVAALLSVMFMRPAHDDNGQRDLANNQSNQQPKDLSNATAGTGDGSGKKSDPIIEPTPPAPNPKPEDAHKTAAANDNISKDAANSAKGTDGMRAGRKPDEFQQTPASKDGTGSAGTSPQTASQGTTQSKPVPLVIPYETKELPTADKPTELHQFDIPKKNRLPDGSPAWRGVLPEMVLLKPKWQNYEDGKVPRSASSPAPDGAVWAILDKSINKDNPITVALFIAADGGPNVGKYRLISKFHDAVPKLGWYRIRVLSPTPDSKPIKDIAFSPFPIGEHDAAIGRHFSESYKLSWQLPKSAWCESSDRKLLPQLVLDRLRISFGDQTLSLSPQSEEPASEWTCSVDEFVNLALKPFSGHIKPPNTKVQLDIKLVSGDSAPKIELALIGVSPFLNGVKGALNDSLADARSDITKECELIWSYDDSKPENKPFAKLPELLKNFTVDKAKDAEQIRKLTQEAIDTANKLAADPKNEKGTKQLAGAADKLKKHLGLYESVSGYPNFLKSFKNVTVVSARIVYELTGTMNMKDANGKAVELTEVVDVVNFDDSKQIGDSKKDGKKQPKSGKKGGEQ